MTQTPSAPTLTERYDDSTALLVVDVQNDFAHPDGNLYVPGADDAIAAVKPRD